MVSIPQLFEYFGKFKQYTNCTSLANCEPLKCDKFLANNNLQNLQNINIEQLKKDNNNSITEVHTHNNTTNNQTILKCIKVTICNTTDKIINIKALILFDNRSIYISNNLAAKLKLMHSKS